VRRDVVRAAARGERGYAPPAMEHLRIVVPHDRSQRVLDLLLGTPSVCNVVFLEGTARKPDGDVILADVAREDTSVVLSDLKELEIHKYGSIALEVIDTQLSEHAAQAVKDAEGAVADAVVWEEVEEEASENVELSGAFVAFMLLSALIAAVGIYLDSPILIVGAMVVGPEFGPIAGFCVAVVQRRRPLALRSLVALLIGFPLAIAAVLAATLVFKATGLTPETFTQRDHQLSNVIASPDFFAFFVAACAGAAGMLSLSTAKSGALIGVLISVTTIPAAANVGVSVAYADWPAFRGSLAQLGINLAAILLAGTATLYVQRLLYRRRRLQHLADPRRKAAGLPVGRSLRTARSRGTSR
jgi:uncharacterized hydrophobic protein (TIGR00271 family)